MGGIITRFKRAQPSSKEKLEKIEKDLHHIARFQVDTEIKQKRVIGRLFLVSCVLYILLAAVMYFFFSPKELHFMQKLLCYSPFVLVPLVVILLRKILSLWYDRQTALNKEKYESLKKEKQDILEEVMENETFKVAKEILEKYAPSQLLPKYLANQSLNVATPVGPRRNQELRRRTLGAPINASTSSATGSIRSASPSGSLMRPSSASSGQSRARLLQNNIPRVPRSPFYSNSQALFPVQSAQAPRYMLPPTPSNPMMARVGWMDKIVDYLVGDGAQHRYALICKYCHSHNGLTPPDDFKYIGFRCVLCQQYNPPKEKRPEAAILPKSTVLIEELNESSSPETPTAAVCESQNEQSVNDEEIQRNHGGSGEDQNNEDNLERSSSPAQSSKSDKDDIEIISEEEVELSRAESKG